MNKVVKDIWFASGLVAVLLYMLPYWLFGEDLFYTVHDSLEVDIPYYILNAKYLFTTPSFQIPELMNGVGKGAIQLSCFLYIPLFLLFKPITAYLVGYTALSIAAYVGMYRLLACIFQQRYKAICLGVAFLFAILPFYPNFGLTFMGIPLVCYAFFLVYHGKHRRRGYGIFILYGLSSSPVFLGFAVLASLLLSALYCWRTQNNKTAKRMLGCFCILCACYFFTHFPTVYAILGEGTTSHRVENLPSPGDAVSFATSIYVEGQYHAASLHTKLIAIIWAVLLVCTVLYKRLEQQAKRLYKALLGLQAFTILVAGFAGFYQSGTALGLRQIMGPFSSFQFDRIYTLAPTLWYVMLAISMALVYNMLQLCSHQSWRPLACMAICLIICVQGQYIISQNRMFWGKSHWPTWRQYYSEDLYFQVKDYIGQPQESYRIVSVGISPSIALYNGFYTLDGYSANYPVSYKHQFRKIIAGELERDTQLQQYFDNWGNRCFIFSAEPSIKQGYYITRDTATTIDTLYLDTDALYEMGGRYLLSAVAIENPPPRMTFCQSFTSETSLLEIYLYQIN